MRYASGVSRLLLVIPGLVAITSLSIAAQSKKPVVTPIKAPAAPKGATVPRLPDGHPSYFWGNGAGFAMSASFPRSHLSLRQKGNHQ